jgi:CYTH domain-containing protein
MAAWLVEEERWREGRKEGRERERGYAKADTLRSVRSRR